jgi:hypothetical protein
VITQYSISGWSECILNPQKGVVVLLCWLLQVVERRDGIFEQCTRVSRITAYLIGVHILWRMLRLNGIC